MCWKTKWRRCPPLGGELGLCGCSSCVWGLRSLLNIRRIMTLPMFLLSDGSLIQMWSAFFALWCRVLLSLSVYCEISKYHFGWFVEMWFLMMRYIDDVHSDTRKDQVNKLQEHLNSIDLHIFTIELPGTDELSFLDTLTQTYS